MRAELHQIPGTTSHAARTEPTLEPFEWAQGYLAASDASADEANARARAQLAALLARQGYTTAAQFVAAPPVSAASAAGAATDNAGDEALAAAIRAHGAPVIPSISEGHNGTPRFFITSAEPRALLAAAEREFGAHGVDAELRLFLDEALAAGDCYLDTAPGLGFAALSAATQPHRVAVHAVLQAHDAIDAANIAASASISGGHVTVHDAPSIEGFVPEPLAPSAFVVLHVGAAAHVAPVLTSLRPLVQAGMIGAVAWRRQSDGAEVAAAALEVLGFTPFALVDGGEGMELVPADAVHTNEYVFSLTDAFIARTPRGEALDAPAIARGADGYTDGAYIAHHARALFEAISEDLAPGSHELGRTPTRGELATAQLEMAWPHAKVVSFDVFDTLVTRRVATPTDVFVLMADRAPFADIAISAAAFAHARRLAEHDARVAAATAHGSAEVTLHDIHTALAARLGLDASRVDVMVHAEQQLELDLCEAHPTLQAWFTRAVREGKAVWCISDTYHTRDFVRRLLTHCGYDMQRVCVMASSEARCSKGEGRLFAQTLQQQQVAPADVLHIGDHDVADDEIPASLGMHTVLHPWASARSTDAGNGTAGDALVLGLAARAARCHEPPPPFWWRFGYSVAGPLLSGFALWLARQFEADGIDRAYFLLRDGEILRDVYHAVLGSGSHIPTALLESSRRAFALPAYDAQRPSLLAQLTVSENPRPVREFFTRVGLSASAFSKEIAAAGFSGPEAIVTPDDRDAERRLAHLMRTPTVVAALRARARDERHLLFEYLEQEGVLAGGRVAFVDVGWNATIQRSLVAALDTEKRQQLVHGYYIGSRAPAHAGMQHGTVRGYLFEAGEPVDRARTIMRLPQLLEFVCSTTRGSLHAFARENGRVVPVHGPVDHDEAQQEAHHAMRTGVMAFAHAFAEARETFVVRDVHPAAAMHRLAGLIESPTFEQAQQVGAIRHGDGLGANRSRALAMFAPDSWSVGDIHRDRKTAYWQAGLAGQHSAQSLVLRTLQWLSQTGAE